MHSFDKNQPPRVYPQGLPVRMDVYSPSAPLPNIPDHLTIPQFIFDSVHECRPVRTSKIPWLIEDETGRAVGEAELRQRTFGLANGLRSNFGIDEDEVVLIFSRNHVDYPVAIWAVHQLGGVISGANPDFSSNELLYQLEQTKAKLMIVHPGSLETALSAAREANFPSERIILFNTTGASSLGHHLSIETLIQKGHNVPSDQTFVERRLNPGEAKTKLAFLSFSSGTTGKPKAVAIAHYALIANVIQIAAHNNVNKDYCDYDDQRYRPGDVAIGVLPFYHIYGLVINLHYILFSAMALVVVPKFNFVEMLNSIVRHRISHLLLVPPQVILLCKHPAVKNYDLRRYIRMIMCGAAPLSHEVNQQLFELLPDAHIGQAYGMTETCTATTMWPIDQKRGTSGSAGQLLPGTVSRIIKSDGSLAGYDEAGELYIKTPSVALGYANNAEATKETFIDGWVRTGDEAKIDRKGEIWILDRLKEIMKVKGFQVAPAELEGCILDHESVSSACVVGIPDDYSGEVPLAFVVLTADANRRVNEDRTAAGEIKASIIQHVAANKVGYKHLAGGVEFIPVIPISPSGKLLRRVLREEAKMLRKTRPKL
ncbi:phenylacetyl-CoA ligase [Lyophyllum atratum]|nr:phenylacetyl-CoA ligase [Lyophyllum atratum]